MLSIQSRLAATAALALLALGFTLPASANEFREGRQAWTTQAVSLQGGGMQPNRNVVGTLPASTRVDLVDDHRVSGKTTWWRVRAQAGEGWVQESQLTMQRPAGAVEIADEMSALPMEATFTPPASGEDRTAELARYWKAIRGGTVEERVVTCQYLPYSGHDDAQFFDLLDGWLKARYAQALRSGIDVEGDVSRCLQGLASSGNAKYQATLAKWAESPQMGRAGRKFILRAQVFLTESMVFNPIVNNADAHVEGRSWATTRIVNMIQSGNTTLQREAMRRLAKDRKSHAAAFDVLERQLQKESAGLDLNDGQRIDIVSWSCKTLALTHDRKYLPTIQKVADAYKDNFRLKRNCGGSVEDLLEPPDEDEEAVEEDAEREA